MNLLFLSLLYHPQDVRETAALSRDGLQNQINAYQWAYAGGLRQNMQTGETLTICNALPVGVFPMRYRRLWLKSAVRDGGAFRELPSMNLPWFKQAMRAAGAYRAMKRWVQASPENRTVLVYSLYLPYMKAVKRLKRRFADVRATVIVTDLPNELGIASGRRGLLKWLEYRIGKRRVALCRAFDAFVLLTAPMAEALPLEGMPSLVMEGLIAEQPAPPEPDSAQAEDARPTVLYTGTLNRELGIAELLEAFRGMPQYRLWLCGLGDMRREAEEAAARYGNIRYFGFVPQAQALALQAQAAALINPRTSQGVFTRYSFPSKTLEYLRSGKPVLSCKLEGIPREYDPYLTYIQPETAEGIRTAVQALLALPECEREAIGERGRQFALSEKSSRAQGAKLLAFLRDTHRG